MNRQRHEEASELSIMFGINPLVSRPLEQQAGWSRPEWQLESGNQADLQDTVQGSKALFPFVPSSHLQAQLLHSLTAPGPALQEKRVSPGPENGGDSSSPFLLRFEI